jgi:hypothetical protein
VRQDIHPALVLGVVAMALATVVCRARPPLRRAISTRVSAAAGR